VKNKPPYAIESVHNAPRPAQLLLLGGMLPGEVGVSREPRSGLLTPPTSPGNSWTTCHAMSTARRVTSVSCGDNSPVVRRSRQISQVPGGSRCSFRVAGVNGALIAGSRVGQVPQAKEKVAEIEPGPGGHVRVTVLGGYLVGRERLALPALPSVQVPEVARRLRPVLGVTGVGRLSVGLLGALNVVMLAQQQTQVEPGRRGMFGVPGVDRPLIGRSCAFDVALLAERGAQAESLLPVDGRPEGGPVRGRIACADPPLASRQILPR
jgi:hypothetical protein